MTGISSIGNGFSAIQERQTPTPPAAGASPTASQNNQGQDTSTFTDEATEALQAAQGGDYSQLGAAANDVQQAISAGQSSAKVGPNLQAFQAAFGDIQQAEQLSEKSGPDTKSLETKSTPFSASDKKIEKLIRQALKKLLKEAQGGGKATTPPPAPSATNG